MCHQNQPPYEKLGRGADKHLWSFISGNLEKFGVVQQQLYIVAVMDEYDLSTPNQDCYIIGTCANWSAQTPIQCPQFMQCPSPSSSPVVPSLLPQTPSPHPLLLWSPPSSLRLPPLPPPSDSLSPFSSPVVSSLLPQTD